MVACIAKNERAALLYSALTALDRRYVNFGVVSPSKRSLMLGALQSLTPDWRQTKLDAYFSSSVLSEMQARCHALVDRDPRPEAVLYWGATNFPLDRRRLRVPY